MSEKLKELGIECEDTLVELMSSMSVSHEHDIAMRDQRARQVKNFGRRKALIRSLKNANDEIASTAKAKLKVIKYAREKGVATDRIIY